MSDNDSSVTVIFMMWGQRCETKCRDAEWALQWLDACASKGWLLAKEIIASNGVVLYDEDQLRDMVDQ